MLHFLLDSLHKHTLQTMKAKHFLLAWAQTRDSAHCTRGRLFWVKAIIFQLSSQFKCLSISLTPGQTEGKKHQNMLEVTVAPF